MAIIFRLNSCNTAFATGIFMRKIILLLTLLIAFIVKVEASSQQTVTKLSSSELMTSLTQKKWLHGAEDCSTNQDPAIEVFQYDESSYIFRQSKCLSYEAPFIYVFVGDKKILVVDTGATADKNEFPLYETVLSIQENHALTKQDNSREIVVIHSHSHSDHYSGDSQFIGQENATVVGTAEGDINYFFSFKSWPTKLSEIDLGGRIITIIPTPGHQEQAISIYDSQTQWLLTGDTFYPGYIYVKNWQAYQASISRLTDFASKHTVSAILGAHIEMKANGKEYYEIGTIYQPDEASLVLQPEDLVELNDVLSQMDDAGIITLDTLIVEPLGFLPKLISSIVGLFL